MLLGYNTNGLAHHAPLQAVELLAELGYQSVALTLDQGLLNPFWPQPERELAVALMRDTLARLGLRSVVETGARYLLDPRIKHEPTLVSQPVSGRARRVEFLKRAVDISADLGSDCVSFWSGIARDDASDTELFERLVKGVREVLDYAHDRGVVIGFEPEPGMFIDTMVRYEQLVNRLDDPRLGLTLDVGHLRCLGEIPETEVIRRWGMRIVNVHLEDMRQGVHEHLMFGEGEIEFPPILAALREVGYYGGVYVELSRHSHVGPSAARQAIDYLRPLLTESKNP